MPPSPAAAATGTLYLIPNTLDHGTLTESSAPDLNEVLPLQVLQIAARLPHWVTENAKSTRAFLKRVHAVVPLAQPLQALDIRELPRAGKGRPDAAPPDLAPLLAPTLAGQDMGLMSEAGLPAVADPGSALVLSAHRAGVAVLPLSGPSSLMLALAASGLDGQRFAFVGYVSADAAERAKRLQALEQRSRAESQTQILIETPYRNQALADALLASLKPGTRLSVSLGLTLAGGWSRTDTVAGWRQRPPKLPGDVPAVFLFLA